MTPRLQAALTALGQAEMFGASADRVRQLGERVEVEQRRDWRGPHMPHQGKRERERRRRQLAREVPRP